jgi:hypothetical protein
MLMEVNRKHYKMHAKLKLILLMSWCETLVFELMYCNQVISVSLLLFLILVDSYLQRALDIAVQSQHSHCNTRNNTVTKQHITQ